MSNTPYEKLSESRRESREDLELEVSEGLLGFRPRVKVVPQRRRTWLLWLVHGLLLVGNITAALFLVKAGFHLFSTNHRVGDPTAVYEYKPLQDIITYQTEWYDGEIGKPTIYAGDGPEVQEAWDEITAPPGKVGIFKLQKEELQAMNLSSIPLSDGTGYVVTIDVFHQLHCLDWVRKAVDEPHRNQGLWREHVDHCIDSIRQSLSCHADTSILTYKWLEDYAYPWPDFRSHHTCRNFEGIKDFASKRFFDAGKPGIAVHPIFGPVDWSHRHGHKGAKHTPLRPYKYIDMM